MDERASLPTPENYRDRRIGLIAFGILEIMFGCLCVLIIIGVLFISILFPQIDETLGRQAIGSVLAFYGVAAVALIWLGIGSILCRRWARVLLLIGSWSLLFCGIVGLGFYALLARDVFAGMADKAAASITMVFIMVFLAVIGIVLPGAMVLFYGSSHTNATCMARDPHPRWTDDCPMSVLATSLWLLLGSLSMLLIPISSQSIMPWFGVLLSGVPATLIILALAALGFYLAWATYRLKMAAWWLCLVATTFFCLSAAVTFLKVDFIELYRRLGYPEQQIEQLRNLSFFSSTNAICWIAVSYILFVIYWIWIRKYFLH